MSGNVNSESAPSARIAAIANEESSSSASIAPCVAMIALTPQTAEPTASSEVNFGFKPNTRPRKVMTAIAPQIDVHPTVFENARPSKLDAGTYLTFGDVQ